MELLMASAGEIDLEPRAGDWLTGYGARVEPSTGTHDPLMCRALLLDSDGKQLLILAFDLIGLEVATVADLRRRISKACGIRPSSVLVSCTHTHAGPCTIRFRGLMGRINYQWRSAMLDRVADLVSDVAGRLKPATLGYSSTRLPGIGTNRQDQSHPLDDELVAVAIDSLDGSAIATVMNYATHSVVLGPSNLQFSGDYPGAAARTIGDLRGGIGIFIQGACGDVDPTLNWDKGWGRGTFDDVEEVGEQVALAAIAALENAPGRQTDIGIAQSFVDIPLQPPPTPEKMAEILTGFRNDLAEAQTVSARVCAEAMLEWATALNRAIARGRVPRSFRVEVFVASLGGLKLAALPFEVYGEIGLRIRAALKPDTTLFAGYSNGLFAYLPSRTAQEQGGYGAVDSHRWYRLLTPIAFGADDLLVDKSVELARRLSK